MEEVAIREQIEFYKSEAKRLEDQLHNMTPKEQIEYHKAEAKRLEGELKLTPKGVNQMFLEASKKYDQIKEEYKEWKQKKHAQKEYILYLKRKESFIFENQSWCRECKGEFPEHGKVCSGCLRCLKRCCSCKK